MKTRFIFLSLILGSTLANATVQAPLNQDKPWELYVQSYRQNSDASEELSTVGYDDEGGMTQWFQGQEHYDDHWEEWAGGGGSQKTDRDGETTFHGVITSSVHYHCTVQSSWPASDWVYLVPGTSTYSGDCSGVSPCSPPMLTWEHCDVSDPVNTIWPLQMGQDGMPWQGSDNKTYTRQADTVIRLRTGGKGVAGRQSVWQLIGWAIEIVNKREVPPYAGRIGNLDPSQVQIMGQPLGADWVAWKTLPDGTEADVTARVPGVAHFAFGVGPVQKYHPYIMASSSTTSANLDTNTPEFCVGQNLSFKLNGLPDYVNAVGRWNLPDKFVNEAYPYSSTCTSYRRNDNLLANTDTIAPCWYVNGQGGHVVVGLNLKFPNGQTASVAADGNFTVVKPSVVHFQPGLTQAYFTTNNVVTASATVNWYTYVRPPAKFSGTGTYVQLVWRTVFYGLHTYLGCIQHYDTTEGEFWLDKDCPYGSDNPQYLSWDDNPTKHVDHADSPEYGPNDFCSEIIAIDQFKTYLRFQPNSGIPVTIGRIDWGWDCYENENNGIWSGNTSTTGPTPDWSDDSFPVWNAIYYGSND
ncbi:MAG: hypothetical protein ABSD57_09300 [Verrucomicrobiota bacterium]